MSDASRHFDRDPAYDAYTGHFLFNCQYSSFNDPNADGTTARRRSMSTAPNIVMPAHGCLQLQGQQWLAGISIDDSFLGEAQRFNYNLKLITDDFTILTPGTAASGGTGLGMAKGHRLYFKEVANNHTEAELDSFWNISFALQEPIVKGYFLRSDSGRYYRVRQTYDALEGVTVAQSDQLDLDAAQVAVFDTGVYDMVTDTMSAGTTTVNVVTFELSKYYNFRHKAESVKLPGDRVVVVPNTVDVKPGTTFTMLGVKWQVVSRQAEDDSWAIHARLA